MRGVQTYISLFSCTLPLFLGNGKNQRTSLDKELWGSKQQAEQRQEQNHHLHENKLNLMQEEQGSSEV